MTMNFIAKCFITALLITLSAGIKAQIIYHDAAAFPLLGKATEETETRCLDIRQGLRRACSPFP